MTESSAATKLTKSLMTAIRLQRHKACRVIVSTQEPTISPHLLELCSFTLVHRFTSPQWFKALEHHLAAISIDRSRDDGTELFKRIIRLNVGEGLLFAPSAALSLRNNAKDSDDNVPGDWKLNEGYLHVRVRNRLTHDGGRSVLAA